MSVAQNNPRSSGEAFTLVEILISIVILALGVLGLGALFPVIIREQRLGTDASAGVSVSNSARALLTQTQWGGGWIAQNPSTLHPAIATYGAKGATQLLWSLLRDPNVAANTSHWSYPIQKGLGKGWRDMQPNNFQPYGQGEWYTTVIDSATGDLQLGYPNLTNPPLGLSTDGRVYIGDAQDKGWVEVPVSTRLYPTLGSDPQFVWDVAFQRVTTFEHAHYPGDDAVRAAIFVRRIDPRIRVTGNAKSITEALLADSTAPEFRFPVGEDPVTEDPTFDGTGRYSGIKTCEVEFFYSSSNPAMSFRDRLYVPTAWARPSGVPAQATLRRTWAQMKQPGQKLVDNMGNVYTVVGSGNEPGVTAYDVDGVTGSDYIKVDPPIPEFVTAERASPNGNAARSTYVPGTNYTSRAIWQVAFTPQIPVSVTLVEVARGSAQ